uniref:Uncharacterized protein n=1 Tax=Arundo donax TaxID=35708 RepID=A0A0A9BWW8_ARUDO
MSSFFKINSHPILSLLSPFLSQSPFSLPWSSRRLGFLQEKSYCFLSS